jgi:endo-1,4-beta-xylanase
MSRKNALAFIVAIVMVVSLLCGPAISSNGAKAAPVTGEKFLGNIFSGSSEPLKFKQYWNQITPENAGKWESVEGSRDSMNWGTLDAIYNYAKSNNMPFKFHTLVWGNQQPSWISSLSQTEQRAEVEEWFAAVADRYDDLDFIDVVNEPLHAPPSYRNALGGDGSTGWDWVITAFQLARQYFPNSKLLINDYGIIADPSAAQRYVSLINLLKARGLVDGIGIQCHAFNMDTVSVSTMNQVLTILDSTGLPIYVSELDMNGDDQTQLQRYQEKFPVLWEHSSVKGITVWGYIEGQTWQSEAYLLRSNGTERPALTWLMGYVGGSSPPPSGDTTPPAVPTGLTATAVSSSSINLDWADNTDSDLAGYKVYRSTTSNFTPGSANFVKQVTTSAYTDTGLTADTTYYYKVTAVDTSGNESQPSAQASAKTQQDGGTTPPGEYNEISLPFTHDGAGEYYWKTNKLSTDPNDWSHYINSWNVDFLEINGKDYTNVWVAQHQIAPSSDGYWYIHYKGSFSYSHVEIK